MQLHEQMHALLDKERVRNMKIPIKLAILALRYTKVSQLTSKQLLA